MVFFSCAQDNEHLLAPQPFSDKLLLSPEAQVVDVRTPEEFNSGHLKNALNINYYEDDFSSQLVKLDKQKPVFVYCKVGGRSAKAATLLRKEGYKNVYDLRGGILAWSNNNLPLENGTTSKADTFTTDDFQKIISGSSLVLVDFYAPWCIPCKQMEPSWEKLSKEFAGKITFSRIDIDQARSLAKEMQVETIPVISLYKNGALVKSLHGYQSEESLRDLLNAIL